MRTISSLNKDQSHSGIVRKQEYRDSFRNKFGSLTGA